MSQKGQQRINPTDIQKILIIRLRRIGDIIMTTPAVSALRKAFPDAFISYVVEEPFRELVEGNSDINEVIVLKKNQSLRDLLSLIQKIRKKKYDVTLDFHSGPRSSFITLFSKAKLRIGYKIKYRNFIYHIKLPRKPETGHFHSVENHINFVKSLGVDVDTIPPLKIPQAKKNELEKVKKFMDKNGLERFKIIIMHIGAGNEFRDWGVENWTKLISLFIKKPQIKVILIGSSEDEKAAREILKKSKDSVLSQVGKLNLREVRELISNSSLFVGPDSGPMHIAAATSTPIVALFGPTLPAHFAPWQAIASPIEKKLDCRPCKQRRCTHKDFRCLHSINPDEVYQACLRYI